MNGDGRMMQLVGFEELRDIGIPFSTQHLNRLIKAGHFPPAIKLGPARNSRKAWLKDDLDHWLAGRIAARDQSGVADG